MNTIEIYISSVGNNINILIDLINNKIKINNQEKNITKEKIDNLIRIIRTWKNDYRKANNLIDSEKFLIKMNTTEGTEIITGDGDYPENYMAFKEWVGEFCD